MWVHKSMPCALCGAKSSGNFRVFFAGREWPNCVDVFWCKNYGFTPRISEITILGGVPEVGWQTGAFAIIKSFFGVGPRKKKMCSEFGLSLGFTLV